MMTEDKFLKSVMDELDHIKQNATQEEISKLDIAVFSPTSRRSCIYGQMTGDCQSNRAKELYPKSLPTLGSKGESLSEGVEYMNGMKRYLNDEYFTPLEAYLPLERANPKEIIEYLKGETETISL